SRERSRVRAIERRQGDVAEHREDVGAPHQAAKRHPVGAIEFTRWNVEVGAAEVRVREYASEPGKMFERAAHARIVQSVAIRACSRGNDVRVVRNSALTDTRETVIRVDQPAVDIDHWREIQVDPEFTQRSSLLAPGLPYRRDPLRRIAVTRQDFRDARRPGK